MKPKTKLRVLVGAIIFLFLFVLVSSLWPKFFPSDEEKVIKCIGENSVLYVQFGSSYSKTQEDLFKGNLELLNIADCFYEPEKCVGVSGTPTWRIKGNLFTGIKSIEELKNLTGC
ncbi:MAG: hypothetical protein Q8Q04_03595 [archaeon]|nr:hypothetical protein [archaeon]